MARILCYTLNPAFDLAIRLDTLSPGTVQRAGASRMEPAGKGINVGRVLRRLGHQVRLGGLMGRDNAAPFRQLFEREQLDDAFIEVAGSTRVNVKLAEDDGRVTDINGPGPAISAADWQRLLATLPSQLADMDAVVVSGSLPPGVTVDAFADWLQRLGAGDRPVWVDTSGSALQAVRQGRVMVLKPNEAELEQLLQRPLPDSARLLEAAQEVVARGWAREVLLSLGAEGACRVRADAIWQAQPPRVPVQNTVCAGDTLLAAALHAELSGWSQSRGLAYAVALSAESVRHVGPGDPGAVDFEQLLAQVQPGRVAQQHSVLEMRP